MPAWLASIIVAVLSKVASKLLERYHFEQDILESKNQIDERLKNFKDAYVEAFDGHPITVEQREKLKKAISNFIRGADGGL